MTVPVSQALLYVRTVAGLRPSQLAHRARLRAQRALLARVPSPLLSSLPVRAQGPGWPSGFTPLDSLLADGSPSAEENTQGRFRLLEEARELGVPADWEQAQASLLWRYHLHYFEWAWSFLAHRDREWARRSFASLWASWRDATPVGRGDAWSPYVVSLRAWVLCGISEGLVAGSGLEPEVRRTLALHAAFVRLHLEQDVGGNHLIKNLKALVGLGVFLGDDGLVRRGSRHLARQLPVQVLADGGHYERSPSYHCQVLGDLVDIERLLAAAGKPPVPGLAEAIAAMRRWLGVVLLPDGDVPLANDTTLAGPDRLRALAPSPADRRPLALLQPSGYAVLRGGDRVVVLADVGEPCPPDLPAHAHADCLSFELVVDGRRVIVDTGTSTYAPGSRRRHERSTAAHNTVEVDGEDQTEVWGVFRAARRARPRLERAQVDGSEVLLSASHDGYERLRGRPRHRRTWRVNERGVEVEDEVTGRGAHDLVLRWHVAPGLAVERRADGSVAVGPLLIEAGTHTPLLDLGPAELATGFGRVAPGHVVTLSVRDVLPVVVRTRLLLSEREERQPSTLVAEAGART